MGARHSKRSVDISGGGKESDESQPLDGKLEKLEEGQKMVVNGASASHSDHKADQHEEQVSNGDPINLPEPADVEAGPSSPSDDVEPETAVSDVIQPPKKKEKVKKKWSFRSLSFSKKDKAKPGKDESAKEDVERVAEVTEEKVEEGGASFLSSVSETIASATDAVGEAVEVAEHKVEEGVAATQDQVEKISAKVAEKAEALVSKMEAMTVQAVDAAQDAIGISHATSTVVDKAEIAVPDANIISVTLPEGEVATAVLPEAPKIESALPEVAEVGKVLVEASESKLITPVTVNVTMPEPITLDSVSTEGVTTIVVSTEQAASDVLSLKAGLTDFLSETAGITSEVTVTVVNDIDIPAVTEVEVTAQEIMAEMPPPLPASPPPSAMVGEVVADVVDTAVMLGEAKNMGTVNVDPSTSRSLSPTTAHVPMPVIQAATNEDVGGGGDDTHASATAVIAEVVTQVIETAQQSIATHLANQAVQIIQHQDQEEEEVDREAAGTAAASAEAEAEAEAAAADETQEDSSNTPSVTNVTTEDHTAPPPNKAAEE